MFAFATPETSDQLHSELVELQVELFKELGLHFRYESAAFRFFRSSFPLCYGWR